MPKVMLINVTHPEESRVGVVADGVLESFEIESLSREHLKGNIYKGVVQRIHPALEAAFVDIGGDRHAFLPLDEVCFRNLPRPPESGNGVGAPDGRRRWRIRDLLHSGDELLVQIVKEPYGNKPPTLTSFFSLPGRYLVLLPGSEEAGVSRRIEGEERIRLRRLIGDLQVPEGFGLIARTAAGFDPSPAELDRDLQYLLRLWDSVQRVAGQKKGPALVYREHDIVLRTIRDFFAPDIDEIYIDNEEVFQRARGFLQNVMPGHEHVLHLYAGEQPIFSAFDVETQFESIFKRRVPLTSGGGIVIDTTEALTAIDVNSGGAMRGANPEETAFRTNKEAAVEVARQLRLRDIGGLIVVDFIDMREQNHIHEVERILREAMRQDRARHEAGRISRFGLMEISRQRLRPTAMASTYTTCPMCEGHGAVRTTESAALVTLRKIHNRVAQGDVANLRVGVPVPVAMYLLNQKRDDVAQLEARYRTRIHVQPSERLMPHEAELEATLRPEPPRLLVTAGPAAEETAAEQPAASSAPAADAALGGKRRRRRRRRKKGTLRAAVALAEGLSALGGSVQVGGEPEPGAAAEPTETAPPVSDLGPAPAGAGRRRGRSRRRSGGRTGPQGARAPAGEPSRQAAEREPAEQVSQPAGAAARPQPDRGLSGAPPAREEDVPEKPLAAPEGIGAPPSGSRAQQAAATEPAAAPERKSRPARTPRRTGARKPVARERAATDEQGPPSGDEREAASIEAGGVRRKAGSRRRATKREPARSETGAAAASRRTRSRRRRTDESPEK